VFVSDRLYIALATDAVQRQPRTVTSTVLALNLGAAALASFALQIVSTTGQESIATPVAELVGVLTTWFHWLFLPLALIGLYFDAWLRRQSRRRLAAGLALALLIGLALDAIIVGALRHRAVPVVADTQHGFWPRWWLERWEWPALLGGLIAMLLPTAIVVFAASARRMHPVANGLPCCWVARHPAGAVPVSVDRSGRSR